MNSGRVHISVATQSGEHNRASEWGWYSHNMESEGERESIRWTVEVMHRHREGGFEMRENRHQGIIRIQGSPIVRTIYR